MFTHVARTFLDGLGGNLRKVHHGHILNKEVPFIISKTDQSIAIDFDKILSEEKAHLAAGGKRAAILYADLRKMANQKILFGHYDRCIDNSWNETWANLCSLARESRWAPCKHFSGIAGFVDLKSRLLLPEQNVVYQNATTYMGYALEHGLAGALIPDDGNPHCLPFKQCVIQRVEYQHDHQTPNSKDYSVFILDADAMFKRRMSTTVLDELSRFLFHVDMDENWMNASVQSMHENPVPRFGQEAENAVNKIREAYTKAIKGSVEHARP